MKISLVLIPIILASFFEVQAQSLVLPTPKGWSKESIIFPIDFAPGIPYKGIEELRFAPGWSQPDTEEYWSYSFMWLIGDKAEVTAPLLQKYLTEYYNGLISSNAAGKKEIATKNIPTTVKIEALIKSEFAFQGTVQMLDYMDEEPITLNIKVRRKICLQNRRMALFFEMSPKTDDHFIWRNFESIWDGFNCN